MSRGVEHDSESSGKAAPQIFGMTRRDDKPPTTAATAFSKIQLKMPEEQELPERSAAGGPAEGGEGGEKLSKKALVRCAQGYCRRNFEI